MKSVTAFAPATIGNVAVGFDLLGFPIDSVGDQITVTRIPEAGVVRIAKISGAKNLPMAPEKNTATVGLLELCRDLKLDFGFEVSIQKGIPIGSGMGGSAASAVGAIVAANALLEKPLHNDELLKYALIGENVASGSAHADNIAPCLYGGLTLARPTNPPQIVRIPVPPEILVVLVHPGFELETKKARALLKSEISLKSHIQQSSNLAGFLVGCFRSDIRLIQQSLVDVLIEPQRAHLIPGFQAVRAAAMAEGALGCSISGAGPSLFALAVSAHSAARIRQAMVQEFMRAGMQNVDAWVAPVRQQGAALL